MKRPERCVWTYDDIDDFYKTACGRSFVFTDGTIKDVGAKFCLYCGGKIVVSILFGDAALSAFLNGVIQRLQDGGTQLNTPRVGERMIRHLGPANIKPSAEDKAMTESALEKARREAHTAVCRSWPHCCDPSSRTGETHAAIARLEAAAREDERKVLSTGADIEALAAQAHAIYQAEAHRQDDVRHPDAYEALPERIKKFDRAFVRWCEARVAAARLAGRLEQAERMIRLEDGEEYPGKTMREVVYLERERLRAEAEKK